MHGQDAKETLKKKNPTLISVFWEWQTKCLSLNQLYFFFFNAEDDGEKIVKIYMKIPAAFNKTEATKIKITFSAEFEILSVLKKVLGDEKMMVSS